MALDPLNSTIRADGETVGAPGQLTRGVLWVYPEVKFTKFTPGRLLLGRGDDCTPQLLGSEISRHHAELQARGPLVTLRDLGSTNGTFHNGERAGEQAVALADQDVVRLGEWLGVVCTGASEQTATLEESGELIAGPRMQALIAQATTVAQSDLPVILLGESGTGKELISRLIHTSSGRTGELVAVNCAALPENLAESELFGHKKGAFTGADRANDGHIRSADRGTLLLDEIGDLPLAIQAKLLRVLEESQVVPLGTSTPLAVNIRVIAAGQHSLASAVSSERFRGDLYARLNGIELRVPALRERREEIPAILRRVAEKQLGGAVLPRLAPRLLECLCLYDWPFNVRQLVQVARQMAVLHRSAAEWTEQMLPPPVASKVEQQTVRERGTAGWEAENSAPPSSDGLQSASSPSLKERREQARDKELQDLQRALDQCGGNVSEAARAIGVSRRKAYRLLKELEDEQA